MTTPTAAPPMPVNAVAMVAIDGKRRVNVTTTWECGPRQSEKVV